MFFFYTARLASYKRVDLIIKAFLELPEKRLIVFSADPEGRYLKHITKGSNNIQSMTFSKKNFINNMRAIMG
jgi:hypothetical protein